MPIGMEVVAAPHVAVAFPIRPGRVARDATYLSDSTRAVSTTVPASVEPVRSNSAKTVDLRVPYVDMLYE